MCLSVFWRLAVGWTAVSLQGDTKSTTEKKTEEKSVVDSGGWKNVQREPNKKNKTEATKKRDKRSKPDKREEGKKEKRGEKKKEKETRENRSRSGGGIGRWTE